MRRLATFVALLVLGLALLGVGGFLALGRVTDAWFDKDLRLRSELAVRAATRGLAASWRPGATELRETLEDITHDERIMGASACLAEERGQDVYTGAWSPERLRDTLRRYLHGERVVILANREPYIHERDGAGRARWCTPASGLVTALEPVMRACSGTWVAHGSGSADRETVDAHDRVKRAPRRGVLRRAARVAHPRKRSRATTTASPTRASGRSATSRTPARVSHRATGSGTSRSTSVRRRGVRRGRHRRPHRARAGLPLRPRAPHDPRRLPRATIITFWHIPWPNAERVGICPWREELLAGPAGSSIVGFHTQQHCNNFIDSVDTYLESRIDREPTRGGAVRAIAPLVRPYPISIEWPVHWLDGIAVVRRLPPRGAREELGLAPDALLGVGVDRLDYTKGIEERLLAVDDALEQHPELRGRFTFVQLAAPSRTASRATRSSTTASRRSPSASTPLGRRATARRAAAGHHEEAVHLPLLPRRGPLLREQPARRHEPRRQGVRRGPG
jgi:trehalose 6-phosphate synthase